MAQISSDTKIKGRLDVQSQIAQTNLRYNVSEIDEDNNQSVCDSRKNVVVNGKSITIKPDKIILNVNPSGNNNIVGYENIDLFPSKIFLNSLSFLNIYDLNSYLLI